MRDRLGGDAREAFFRDKEQFGDDGAKVENNKLNFKPKENNMCFWCRQEGHHQADCTNPPFCFRCKTSGHLAAKCPSSMNNSVHMYGFGFPGQGFYTLKIPGVSKPQSTREHVGQIKIKSGEGTVEKVEQELRHLVDNKWNWRVKQIAEKEYMAIFPYKQILDAFSRSRGTELSQHKIMVIVSPSSMDPPASSRLQTGWVQLKVPDQARNVDAVTAIAELAGKVISVDEVSLIREVSVRVKIKAREIAKINGIIEFFIEGVRYDVIFTPELKKMKAAMSDKHPPEDKRPDDDNMDDEDDDTLFDSEDDPISKSQEGGCGDGGESPQAKDGRQGARGRHRELPSPCSELQEKNQEESQPKENVKVSQNIAVVTPLAMFNPETGSIVNFEDSGGGEGQETKHEKRKH